MEASGCNVPTSGNTSLLSIIVLVFSALEALTGMALNAFISAMSCIHGMKSGQLRSVDKILTALGITRFCYLCTFLVKIFWMSFSSKAFEVTSLYQMFKAAIWFLSSVCFCFSACLSLFYCIKIVSFSCCWFVRLKMGISRLVPWMLLVSVFGSLANTYPFFQSIYTRTCKNSSSGSSVSANQTLEDFAWETDLPALFGYCGTGFSVVFSVSLASSCLLLFSLWRHTCLMQSSSASFSSPSLAAHFQAVKTIMSLLIVDSVNFVGVMLLLSNIFSEGSHTNLLITVIIYICPCAQSQFVIWGNPKLKRAFIRLTDRVWHVLGLKEA